MPKEFKSTGIFFELVTDIVPLKDAHRHAYRNDLKWTIKLLTE